MNLCEAIELLSGKIDEVRTEEAFQNLLGHLNAIVKHDVPHSFIKATLLALVRSAHAPIGEVQTKLDGKTLSVSFAASGVRAASAQI